MSCYDLDNKNYLDTTQDNSWLYGGDILEEKWDYLRTVWMHSQCSARNYYNCSSLSFHLPY